MTATSFVAIFTSTDGFKVTVTGTCQSYEEVLEALGSGFLVQLRNAGPIDVQIFRH